MPPCLSVIIPLYNMAEYLKEAVASVLSQTWGDFEIVIINDGSTDHSLNVVEELCKKDSRIRFFTNAKNSGAIFTVNRGIQEAKGKYIHLLAADDKLLLPTFFEKMVPPLEAHPQIPMSTSDHGTFHDGSNQIYIHRVFPHLDSLTFIPPEEFVALCHTETIQYWLFAMGTIFRRELFFKYGFFRSDLPVLSDWYLIHLFALKKGCFYLPGTYVAWRFRGSGNLYHHMKKTEVIHLLRLISRSREERRLFNKSRLLGCYIKQQLTQIALRPQLWNFIFPFIQRKLENTAKKFFRLKN
jgi:glycosyltransferase involved in cell wall biosynthesis